MILKLAILRGSASSANGKRPYLLQATDHISLQQRFHPAVLSRFRALREDDNVAVRIVTVEEPLRIEQLSC